MAGTIELAAFLPYVLRHLPGCPHFVAESYLRMAAIEFCERTRCWRKITTVDLTDENTEALVAPYHAAIHQIEYASFSSGSHAKTPLTPTQYSDIAERHRADLEQEGPPRYITQVNPNTVTVFPLTAGELEVSLFLKPRMGQEFAAPVTPDRPIADAFNIVPDFLLTQWGEAISDGALAKALLQPQTQWYDPQRAGYFEARFERACDSKFAQSLRGQQRAPKRTRFRFV